MFVAAILAGGLVLLSRAPDTGATTGTDATVSTDSSSQTPGEASAPLAAPGGPFRAANENAVAADALDQAPPAPAPASSANQTGLVVNTSVIEAVRPGARLHYTVRYTNATGSPLTNVVVRDTLSSGQSADGTYSADPVIPGTNYTWDELDMTWAVGDLAVGAAGLIQFQTVVNDRPEPSAQQPVHFVGNSIRVTADGMPERGDESVSRVVGPILELTLAAGPNPVLPGHTLAYTLTLRNLDRADAIAATGVVISAVLPNELTYGAATNGGTYEPSNRQILWSIPGAVEPGTSLSVSYNGRVDPLLVAPRIILVDGDKYVARADQIKVNDVLGKFRISTAIDALLQKSVAGPRTIVRGATAFPGDIITYTITTHNPGATTLSGVVISDTLPGAPTPFQFRTMLSGPPPAVDGPRLVWSNLTVPANGRISLVFTALVPRNTFITDNSNVGIMYGSNVVALTPDFPFPAATNVGQIRVFAPLTMNKIVSPGKVQAGESVIYTITLENRGTVAINTIRLTDTMQGPLFRYTGMRLGPEPENGLSTNPVVWNGLSVPAGGSVKVAFSAFANGWPLMSYDNSLKASTPDTFIPARSGLARVTIDSPFRIQKTVNPTASFPNADVHYNVSLSNVTTVTWVLDRVTDTLPAGFFDKVTGRGSSVMEQNPPAQIRPGESWQGGFDAYVSGDVDCSLLPRDFPNARGKIALEFSSPVPAVFGNASDLAPLRIKPHVSVYITPTRQSVLPGGRFVYKIRMDNNSTAIGTNSDLKVTTPAGFTYLGSITGPEPTVTGRELRWDNVQIAAGSDQTFQVAMQAGPTLGSYGADFEGAAEGIFCIQRLRNLGRVDVRSDVLQLFTRPLSNLVPPGGPIDFELKINNTDPDPFILTAVTNTLPPGFEFVSMVGVGPSPNRIEGRRVVWTNVQVPGRALTTWRIKARASSLYGAYQDMLEAYTPEVAIQAAVSTAFEVVPMVQIGKAASVGVTYPGSTFIYTVTLFNQSAAAYADVTITDTLPAGLTYERIVLGPAPQELGPGRAVPVWRGLSIAGSGGSRTLAFEVGVDPNMPEGTVFNHIDGYSANVTIPGTDSIAPVFVSRGGVPPATVTPPRTPPTPGPSPTATRTVPPAPSFTPGPSPTRPPTPIGGPPVSIFMPAVSRRS